MKSELRDLNLSGSLGQPAQRLDAFSPRPIAWRWGVEQSLTPESERRPGAADKSRPWPAPWRDPQARLDEHRQLLEMSDAVLAARLQREGLPRPQMQLCSPALPRRAGQSRPSPSATW